MFKTRLKALLTQWFPRLAAERLAIRARSFSHSLTEKWGCVALNEKLAREFGHDVLQGPFRGVTLTPMALQEHIAPYLLGTYEHELEPAWESVLHGSFRQILDIGAKFGFYAVGLARHFPQADVIAFDTDPWARKATEEMCEKNGTRNVVVESLCDPDWLNRHLKEHSFILSDCEGYESTLFAESNVPALWTATMLIEIHEHASPGVAAAITKKFSESHSITVMNADTTVKENARLRHFDPPERAMAANEFRSAEQSWLLLTPKGFR